MPYRVTQEVIKRQRQALDAIVSAKGQPVVLESQDTARLAFKIREAIHAARHLGVEPYASLSVRIMDMRLLNQVYIIPKVDERAHFTVEKTAEEFEDTTAVSVFDVVMSANAHQGWRVLKFPNALLDDLASIQRWCEKNGRVCIVDDLIEGGTMLTLKRIE